MNTTNYASSNSYEDVDGMFIMHTFSNVCYPADRCVLCSSRWHIKHLVLGDGTAQGGKYWVLLQGNTRRRLMHRVTTESSSHMSNKTILIDSHRLKNEKIYFSEFQFALLKFKFPTAPHFQYPFSAVDCSALKTLMSFLSYFVLQACLILLNQLVSTESVPKQLPCFNVT